MLLSLGCAWCVGNVVQDFFKEACTIHVEIRCTISSTPVSLVHNLPSKYKKYFHKVVSLAPRGGAIAL